VKRLIEWFNLLREMVDRYRKYYRTSPATFAVVRHIDGSYSTMVIPRILPGFELPKVHAKFWRDDEPPEIPKNGFYQLVCVQDHAAFYEEKENT
jgi:hypothetical protein